MTPVTHITPESADLVSIAVALGRIESEVKRISGLDDRVRKLEQTVERIEAKQTPKTPWYAMVGGFSGIAALIVSSIFILNSVLSH
jgi:hypothetical protein